MSRQRLILFVLLVLLVLSSFWAYMKWPRQQTVSSLTHAPGQKSAAVRPGSSTAPAAPREGAPILRLDLLDREQPTFSGYRRNIFKPLFVDEVKLLKQKAAAPKPVLPPIKTPPPLPPTPPAMTPGPPGMAPETVQQRELGRFTFLGFLKKDNRRTVFLAKDKDIILVKKGDVFAGRYEASAITDQALTIRVRDTGEEIVIPLLENQPLHTAAR